MTPTQIELARSALGLKDGNKRSYRNRFYADPAHENWNSMVAAGEAEVEPSSKNLSCFFLTRAGAEKALRKGETLCPEDFPAPENEASQ